MALREHDQRRALIEELHARPFHDFDGQGRFIRYIYLAGEAELLILNHLNSWLGKQGCRPIDIQEKFRLEEFPDFTLRIERHSEFVTIGLIVREGAIKRGLSDRAFAPSKNKTLPFDMIAGMPVPLFHAIWLEIGGGPPARFNPETVSNMLGSRTSASSLISEGNGQIHFSFDIDVQGYSRAILFSKSITALRKGRLVLRLIEMETYRMLALLGLPVVRQHMGRLHAIEGELAQLTQRLTAQINHQLGEAQALLPELSALSAEIEEMSANTSYRLSATKAYKEIFLSRLEGLRTSRLDGHQGLYGFLDRRMMPALQTCEAFEDRLSSLSARISRAGSLLRAQTETKIQEQNRNLLASMDRRAQAQLRLQQTVEGLSVIAGTYYGVGLVGYLAKILPHQTGLNIDVIKALSVPIIALLIWWLIHKVSRTLDTLNQ